VSRRRILTWSLAAAIISVLIFYGIAALEKPCFDYRGPRMADTFFGGFICDLWEIIMVIATLAYFPIFMVVNLLGLPETLAYPAVLLTNFLIAFLLLSWLSRLDKKIRT